MKRKVLDNHKYYTLQMLGKLTFKKHQKIKNLIINFFISDKKIGARRYLMKEPDSSIESCKRRLFYMYLIDRFLRVLLFGYLFYLLAKRVLPLGKDQFLGDLLLPQTHNDTIIEKF